MAKTKTEKEKLIVIDPGHGSIDRGKFATPGKRTKNGIGNLFIEGVSNRAQAFELQMRLLTLGIKSEILAPENRDIGLRARVSRANELQEKYNTFIISIHSNAFKDPAASGWEIFTSYGETKSDEYAEIFAEEFEALGLDRKIRRGTVAGKVGKEANFYILKYTQAPAVLVEDLFFTNPKDLLHLESGNGRLLLVDYKVKAIQRIWEMM